MLWQFCLWQECVYFQKFLCIHPAFSQNIKDGGYMFLQIHYYSNRWKTYGCPILGTFLLWDCWRTWLFRDYHDTIRTRGLGLFVSQLSGREDLAFNKVCTAGSVIVQVMGAKYVGHSKGRRRPRVLCCPYGVTPSLSQDSLNPSWTAVLRETELSSAQLGVRQFCMRTCAIVPFCSMPGQKKSHYQGPDKTMHRFLK